MDRMGISIMSRHLGKQQLFPNQMEIQFLRHYKCCTNDTLFVFVTSELPKRSTLAQIFAKV